MEGLVEGLAARPEQAKKEDQASKEGKRLLINSTIGRRLPTFKKCLHQQQLIESAR